MKKLLSTFICAMAITSASAQLSTNPDKFLGNITTRYQMDAGGGVPQYYKLWNQVTPENESKWSSVQGNRSNFNWGCDTPFNYAKQHNFTFKFHAFLWGAQYPSWLESLSIKDRFDAVETWFDAIRKKYATLPLVDVVNEAVGMHQAGNPLIKASVGGGGKTGYDWLIKAFEMAYERFPDAILIYNDYNSIRWDIDNYITLVQAIRDAGAPIDAYGNQSHDVNDISATELKNALKKQQDALKMPMYITELDIDVADDTKQANQYKSIFPSMWEAEYCAGVTLWGYIHGATWVDNSGLYKSGKERPAMTWLKEYMATDQAKNAKSPFPGMKKEASIYIKPADYKVAKGDVVAIKVRARMATKTIEKVDLYVGSTVANATTLVATMTEAPYITEYTPSTSGWKILKAVVTTTDGSTYERYGRVNVLTSTTKRETYNEKPFELPGTIIAGEYDKGASGVSYANASRTPEKTATKDDGWMEYTVDVKEEGIYRIDAEVAATKAGGTFHLTEYGLDSLTFIANIIEVPVTGSATDFKTLSVICKNPISAGQHRICLNVDKGGFYIKSLKFSRYEEDKNISVSVASLKPATISVGDATTVTVNSKSTTSTIASVDFYANSLYIGTATEAPYTVEFQPAAKGSYTITAIATDAEGKVRQSTVVKTLKVNGKREPYKSVIDIPGVIQAENFDKGGEGLSFHDSDSDNQGDANYRTDNEGLDLVKGNNGTAIGYTASSEWTEYSVNVTEPGEYEYVATISNGSSSTGGFIISLVKGATQTQLAKVSFEGTGGWDTYKTVTGKLTKNLAEGEQILRFTINPGNCNIDKVELKCTLNTGIDEVAGEQSFGSMFNLSGQKVGSDYRGIIIRNGRKILKK